ncbi:MAG TPA: hypothetical protein VK447_09835 [Myxococcaceae bacterium]|nr:hypothetical protein [Myxococcaceae bacterium]
MKLNDLSRLPSTFVNPLNPANVARLGEALAPAGRAVASAAGAAGTAAKDWYSGAATNATLGYAGTATGGLLNNAKALGQLGGALYGVFNLPNSYGTAIQDIRDVEKNGNWGKALSSSALVAKTTLSIPKAIAELAATGFELSRFKGLEKVAHGAVDDVLKGAFKGLVLDAKGAKDASKLISQLATRSVMEGKLLNQADLLAEVAKANGLGTKLSIGAKQGASTVLNGLGDLVNSSKLKGLGQTVDAAISKQSAAAVTKLLNPSVADDAVKAAGALMARPADVLKLAGKEAAEAALGKVAAKVAATEGTEAAAKLLAKAGTEAGAKALAKTGASTLGKAVGRFAPGVNVALAGLDVANAVGAWTDPKASVAKKVTSTVTALGSVVGATNIPIVSQIGSAVSIGSTVVGAVLDNPEAIKNAAKKVGTAVVDGAKAVGNAVADGAKAVGNAVADGAKKVGGFVKKLKFW